MIRIYKWVDDNGLGHEWGTKHARIVCRDNSLLQQNSLLPELTFENNLGSLKLKRKDYLDL